MSGLLVVVLGVLLAEHAVARAFDRGTGPLSPAFGAVALVVAVGATADVVARLVEMAV